MPSRRVVVIVLGAAVLVGATAGVSAAVGNVEFPRLLAAGPSRTPDAPEPPKASPKSSPSVPAPSVPPPAASPPPPSASPQPTVPALPDPSEEPEPAAKPVAPTAYVEVDFSLPGMGPNGEGGSTSRVEVPKDWPVEGKGTQWRDFRDPTNNLLLRIRGDRWASSDEEYANQAREERSKAKGYRELGWKEFTLDEFGEPGTGIEYRFSWVGTKGTRYGVERYFLDGNVMVGGYAWEDQLDLVAPAVERASHTYVGGGG
ncbi:hypothetical protein [Tenggerimyces flavus]|uniref:Serine/threonine protein kinase n=1 Tax=Tenggerimyces flavus TaxID=1708749 RepID=A0ABV7Y239_9ACTN|nr:hypothetical protein [Tenggerimyces flavus]MBM7790828.1 pyruvate/2-oxoglutarate dehydrogenase complex dihydrolipoamide acyltransferase (E2) component [Tenggerimyces flavus]